VREALKAAAHILNDGNILPRPVPGKSPLTPAPDVDLAEAELANGTSPFHKVRPSESSGRVVTGSKLIAALSSLVVLQRHSSGPL
jgi:hypothetical protein